MSYSGYTYSSSGTGYDSYQQQYDTLSYSSASDQYGQHSYTSSAQSSDQYIQPPGSTDYVCYSSTADTGYTSSPATAYLDSSSSYASYQYSQDAAKNSSLTSYSSEPVDGTPETFLTTVSQYTNVTSPPTESPSQPASSYDSYQYQSSDYSQISQSYDYNNSVSSVYAGPYDQTSSEYSYQDDNNQPSSTWPSHDQYISYSSDYYEQSPAATNYHQKEEPVAANLDYSTSLDRYSQESSHFESSTIGNIVNSTVVSTTGGGYPHTDISTNTDDHGDIYQTYVTPVSSEFVKPQYSYGGYSSPAQFTKEVDNTARSASKSYNSDRTGLRSIGLKSYNSDQAESKVFGVTLSSSSYSQNYSGGGGGGHNGFQRGSKDGYFGRERNSRFCGNQSTVPTQTTPSRSYNNLRCAGADHSSRGFSYRGGSGSFYSRGSSSSVNHSNTITKPTVGAFDARNRINEVRNTSTLIGKTLLNMPPFNKNKTAGSVYKPQEPVKKEIFKAPARPQDKLLNEIEEKEKAQRAEELKKCEEEKKKAEEKRKKDEEERQKVLAEEKKRAEELLRKKVAEEAVKAAPPSKPPQTAEEIAHEEEIQRKIRESVVIISPEQETALLKEDPSKDIEMSEELRKLLKTLTTNYLCKLCSVRIVGPQMAAMHYNGKNHLKKLRNFVQTNGRSAGFNLDTLEKSGKEEPKEMNPGEKKAEVVEITEIDEKQYCKVCRVSFSQESQADMHYKGKNHAKRLKSVGAGNGPELFECKICCVTVTAQEHLTAHLNGSRHKQQVRKMDANENYRGGVRARGRGPGFPSRGARGGRGGAGNIGNDDWKLSPGGNARGRGFTGRGHIGGDMFWRGQGFKRRGGFDDGMPLRGDFGPPFFKRPRF